MQGMLILHNPPPHTHTHTQHTIKRYVDALHGHFSSTVLSKLPEGHNAFDYENAEEDMGTSSRTQKLHFRVCFLARFLH